LSSPTLPSIDISIVLNLHDEARFLDRTVASLREAVAYARADGLSAELVIVLDNATSETAAKVAAMDFSEMGEIHILEVSHGSLGPARNSGIAASRGRYIATADGDDLVSFNFFSAMIEEAERNPGAIIVPEFLYAFGTRYHLWQYFGTDRVSKLAFFGYHPFCSRVFFPRELAQDIRYVDTKATRFFAYEDWHFNCEAVAAGYEFRTAANTILFYRQRSTSIMAQEGHDKLCPHSRYFSSDHFLKGLRVSYDAARKSPKVPKYAPEGTRLYCMNSQILLELVYAANQIESGIDFEHLKYMPMGSNVGWPYQQALGLASAYFEALEKLNGRTYDDIVLLPFLSNGGAEKFLLEVSKSLLATNVAQRVLIMTGQEFEQHEGVDQLPSNVDFLDLRELADRHGVKDLGPLLLRLIQSSAPRARLHTNGPGFAIDFLLRYYRALPENRIAYYYFCAETLPHQQLHFTYGSSLNFLSEALNGIGWVISDHARILEDLQKIVHLAPAKAETLYAPVPPSVESLTRLPYSPGSRPLRILWASRIDTQKRPDLVPRIARKLEERGVSVSIDMYGSSVFGYSMPAGVSRDGPVRHRGAFRGFSSLPHDQYDLFLYTSSYDGLPNVVLEALSCSMLVVAPDVGGLREVITPQTGVLIAHEEDDEVLIEHYADALAAIANGGIQPLPLIRNAQRLIEERHSEEAHRQRIASIFRPTGN